MANFYTLDEKGNPVPEDDVQKWGEWHQRNFNNMRVGKTYVRGIRISTVFLSIDHRFLGKGEPLLFETMIFGRGKFDEMQWRYSTREEAVAGHAAAVKLVEEGQLKFAWKEFCEATIKAFYLEQITKWLDRKLRKLFKKRSKKWNRKN